MSDSLDYWNDILQKEHDGTGLVNIGLSHDAITALQNDFNALGEANESIQSGDPEELRKFILNSLDTENRCVLPIGYLNRNSRTEHTFLCILEKKDNKIYCHLLDKGEASVMHPLVKAEESCKEAIVFFQSSYKIRIIFLIIPILPIDFLKN